MVRNHRHSLTQTRPLEGKSLLQDKPHTVHKLAWYDPPYSHHRYPKSQVTHAEPMGEKHGTCSFLGQGRHQATTFLTIDPTFFSSFHSQHTGISSWVQLKKLKVVLNLFNKQRWFNTFVGRYLCSLSFLLNKKSGPPQLPFWRWPISFYINPLYVET